MIPIYKFDPKNFDRSRMWEDRYRTMYTLLGDLSSYKKQAFWPELEKKFDQKGNYLDAGCGIGGWILFLSEQGYRVEGIDAHPQAVRSMSEYNPDLSLKIAGSDAIPFADSAFNGILSIGSLEYTQGAVENSLKEFHRLLNDGGFLCVEVPLLNTLRRFAYVPLKAIQAAVMRMTNQQPTFAYYLFGRNELEDMLMNAGFAIEAVMAHDLPDSGSHYGLYATFPFLRGSKPYELNMFGKIVKAICNTISPWVASAGVVVIARKK